MATSLPLFTDQLDPKIDREFEPLCSVLTKEEVLALAHSIHEHVADIEKALRRNEFLDIRTAKRIAERLLPLLASYQDYNDGHQKLIAGAARYFVDSSDTEPDTMSIWR